MLVAPYLSARDLLIDRLGAQGAGRSQAYALSPADDQLVRPDGFINAADSLYLKHYAIEHLIELISREHLNRFDCMYQYKQNINRKQRALAVDLVFQACSSAKIDDKSIVYQAVSLMDRYYNQQYLYVRDANDIYLTGFTALFTASKNSEVEPLSLRDIKSHFLSDRFAK